MRRSIWRPVALGLALLAVEGVQGASAQGYFGRNKVQYELFDFHILRTEHFDLYFYPAESLATFDAGRMAERWYNRHSDTFRHQFDRKSVVLYADHPDFEQTNVVGDSPDEAEQGVTEGMRTRVVMPFQGSYADNDHVLGHELVHVFQYNIAETSEAQGLQRLETLPGWLIEGMAEYFSLGRDNALTAMWMRDAVQRDSFPTIRQLTFDQRAFFPYRYGQAMWAYVGGRWGDRAIVDVYRTALKVGLDAALVRVLGESADSLSKDWAAANRALYTQQIVGRTKPQDAGEPVLQANRKNGEMNLAPTISPDGKYVAFFSRRNLFTIDLYVANAKTGEVVKRLAGPSSSSHFDAVNFINSSGAWSPDAKHFAFIVDEGGNNDIAILNADDGDIERTIKVPGVGAISSIAWSPDGKTLAISGQAGGLSDLYLIELQTEHVKRLTNDKYADFEPTFSPDGKTIAFATDRGPTTDFQALTYSPLQLATISVDGGPITVYSPFPNGKEINPQYSPDGQSLFFLSDQDGFSDVYRLNLAAGTVTRVTRVSTGVSGITEISPALTVSPTTGRMLFTVFRGQGYSVVGLDAAQTIGTPTEPSSRVYSASILPPGDVPGSRTVTAYLKDPARGLESGDTFKVLPYHSSFSLDAISQPSVGVSVGGPFGNGFAGGIAALWGDQLSDRQIYGVIQANGTAKDIGGAVEYLSLRRRWNWSLGAEHIPYLTGFTTLTDTTVQGLAALNENIYLQRVFLDQLSLSTQYPFSQTQRMEFGISGNHVSYNTQLEQFTILDNQLVNETVQTVTDTTYRPLTYAQGDIAFVSDNSYQAFIGPVSGERWRLDFSPTAGTLQFNTVLADYRRYFFAQPFTFAVRGLSYGRYGRDAEDYTRLPPIFLGDETLMRGYGYGSFGGAECVAAANSTACPVIDRLFGSRVGVFNAELRIPLFGSTEFGLLNLPFLPTEIAPFFDGGIAYSGNQPPSFRWATSANVPPTSCANVIIPATAINQPACVEHIPVFSAGVTARVNILGYMVLEVYMAHPFQRPGKSSVVGVQLAQSW